MCIILVYYAVMTELVKLTNMERQGLALFIFSKSRFLKNYKDFKMASFLF